MSDQNSGSLGSAGGEVKGLGLGFSFMDGLRAAEEDLKVETLETAHVSKESLPAAGAPKGWRGLGRKLVKTLASHLTFGAVVLGRYKAAQALLTIRDPERPQMYGEEARGKALTDFRGERRTNALTKQPIAVDTGTTLDSMIVQPTGHNRLSEDGFTEKKWVVMLHGHGARYEHSLSTAAELADQSGRNVLCFNYRGTGESTGVATSMNDFVKDALIAVQMLVNKGVDPEDITLYGHSMGGAVGAKAADILHHDQHAKVNLIADRTVRSTTSATRHFVRGALEDRVGRPAAAAIASLASGAARLFSGQLRAEKHIRHLPKENVMALRAEGDTITGAISPLDSERSERKRQKRRFWRKGGVKATEHELVQWNVRPNYRDASGKDRHNLPFTKFVGSEGLIYWLKEERGSREADSSDDSL